MGEAAAEGPAAPSLSVAVADAGTAARASLDRVEQDLGPGHGKVDLFAFAKGSPTQGQAGGGVELEHRFGSSGALFTRGWLGAAWDASSRQLAGEVTAGARWRW